VRRFAAAGAPAGTAVVGIGSQIGTHSVSAVGSSLHATVDARSGHAGDILVETRRRTRRPATPAIENVILQISAVTAAAGLAIRPAVVAAGAAVGVRLEVAADPLARGDRTAGVAAT